MCKVTDSYSQRKKKTKKKTEKKENRKLFVNIP